MSPAVCIPALIIAFKQQLAQGQVAQKIVLCHIALSIFVMHGPEEHAMWCEYFEKVCLELLEKVIDRRNHVSEGGNYASQLLAISLLVLRDLEVRTNFRCAGERTIHVCLQLAKPEVASALPEPLHRVALQAAGCHLYIAQGLQAAGLLARWLHRFWTSSARAPSSSA